MTMTTAMAPATAPHAKKSISWNCTVTSARSSAQSTAVREESFDGDALDREFLNGAYSYAEFKKHRAESRGEHVPSVNENVAAVAAAVDGDPGGGARHDSSGCFSVEVGEIISNEFVMMKYKQASYNAQFDDSRDRLVASINSRTEDGAWDVSGTFDYYYDEDDEDVQKLRRPAPRRLSGSSLRASASIVPRLAPVSECSESSKSNPSSSSNNPSFSLEEFGDMHASAAIDFGGSDGLVEFMEGEAKKSERIARGNIARARMGKENEWAAKDTRGKEVIEVSSLAAKEELIPEDSINSLNLCDVHLLARNDQEATRRIAEDSMTTLFPGDVRLLGQREGAAERDAKEAVKHASPITEGSMSTLDLRDLHLLGRGTGGSAIREDSTSSMACLTGHEFLTVHKEKGARMKEEGAKGIAPILEDSISASGFDSQATASAGNSFNYEMLKAKGTNIISPAHDSMAAIDVSHLVGVVNDLKAKGPNTVTSAQESKFAMDVSRLRGVMQDLDTNDREEEDRGEDPTGKAKEKRGFSEKKHIRGERPARKAKETNASQGKTIGDQASAASPTVTLTSNIDGIRKQQQEGANDRREEGGTSDPTASRVASIGNGIHNKVEKKGAVEAKPEAITGIMKKSKSSFKGGRRSTVDDLLPSKEDVEKRDAKGKDPGNRPIRRRCTVDTEYPSLRTKCSVRALSRNINARSKHAKKGLKSRRRASVESNRRASTETKDTECSDGSGEDDLVRNSVFDLASGMGDASEPGGKEYHMNRVSSILYG